MDIGMSGIEGLHHLKEKHPETKTIMLTVFEDNKNVFRAILAGADGYLLKKTLPMQFLQAIEAAAKGGSPLTPAIARKTLNLKIPTCR